MQDFQREHESSTRSVSSRYRSSEDYDALLSDAKGIKFWRPELSFEEHEHLRKDCRLDRGNSNCCYWDLVGRPVKHNEEKPLFDYQQAILQALVLFKKIRIKKFRGGGVTEEFLRFGPYLSLASNQFKGQQAFIITGIKQDLSNILIKRIKDQFATYYPNAVRHMDYTTKSLSINDVTFTGYPARNPEASRGQIDVFYIVADEFDFHTRNDQQAMEATIKPYRIKSDALIALNSTTKNANGRYIEMDREWDEYLNGIELNRWDVHPLDILKYSRSNPQANLAYLTKILETIRHRFFLLEFDWHWGVIQEGETRQRIYTYEEIEELRLDPTFPGEYELQYLSHLGNLFNQMAITKCLTEDYNPDFVTYGPVRCMGIDPGLGQLDTGGSLSGICVLELANGFINVMYADEHEVNSYDELVDLIFKISNKFMKMHKYFLDGSNFQPVYDVKEGIGENSDQYFVKEQIKKAREMQVKYDTMMSVVPLQTNEVGRYLIEKIKKGIERPVPRIRIHKKFKKLEAAMRTAYAIRVDTDKSWKLDKDNTNFPHLFDAFRYAMYYFDY